MKLKSLTVNNFRSLNGDGNTITFDSADIIFIFGQNDIGKSSFLRAYEYFIAPTRTNRTAD